MSWIGVDLDGTLAYYYKWNRWNHIGEIIPLMKSRILEWHSQGLEVRIFTARIAYENDLCYVSGERFSRDDVVKLIQDWLEANGLPRLKVTCTKDLHMIELWDDRCIQVIPNTGRTLAEEHLSASSAHKGAP